MKSDVWVHGAVFVLALGQCFVFWYLYRRSGFLSTHDTGQSTAATNYESSADVSTHRVACPHCGAVNTARYRYCRSCADELPRSAG